MVCRGLQRVYVARLEILVGILWCFACGISSGIFIDVVDGCDVF